MVGLLRLNKDFFLHLDWTEPQILVLVWSVVVGECRFVSLETVVKDY